MFGPFERAVAGRYLRARRGERFVSIIAIFSLVGISLGVATLIIVMSVMGGFKVDLLNRILGLNGHLTVFAAGKPLGDYERVTDRIRAIPNVVSAAPVVESGVFVTTDHGGGAAAAVRGMTNADLRKLHSLSDNIRLGSLDQFDGDDAVAIGIGLAQRLGVAVGDRVTLISGQGAATVIGFIPRVRAYRVVAVFQTGLNQYDTAFTYMPLAAAQVLFQQPGAVNEVEVRVADPERIGPVARAIRDTLAGQPLTIADWQHSNDAFFAAVQVEQNVMFIILTLIIVVAAFNVVSSLIMMVKDKTADIAVLRTLGAGRGAVMRIFLMCGASVGVLGTVVGTVLGVAFCLNIERIRHVVEAVTGSTVFNPEVYYLTHLPARLDWNEVVQIVALALALALLATLYPSWRAARTDPVDALRNG